ncbi:MAG: helix-turn-helix domain-containing protein [Calothrix sp. MO_167.B42]|nr:helix-turn-helix domain-containing protein [Calothrix sp. MO_167.B42]
MAKCFGCSRFVHNHFFRLTTSIYAELKQSLGNKKWAKPLTGLKLEFV